MNESPTVFLSPAHEVDGALGRTSALGLVNCFDIFNMEILLFQVTQASIFPVLVNPNDK